MKALQQFQALVQSGQLLEATRYGWQARKGMDSETPPPELCELYVRMGDAYKRLGYDLAAQRVYEISLYWVQKRCRPAYPDPDLWARVDLSLGELAFGRGDLEMAVGLARRAEKAFSPGHPGRDEASQWHALAWLLLQAEELPARGPEPDLSQNSLARLAAQLRRSQQSGAVAYTLGRELLELGRGDLAELWLKRAQAEGVEPRRLPRYLKRARASHPEELYEMEPPRLLERIRAEEASGRHDCALPLYRELVHRDSRCQLELWALLGRCYMQVGDHRRGVLTFEQVVELDFDSNSFRAELEEHRELSTSNLELLPEMSQNLSFMLDRDPGNSQLQAMAPALERVAVSHLAQDHPERILAEDNLARLRGELEPEAPAAPEAAVRWEPGQVVAGLYEVENLLGAGGMGRVFRVRHRQWDHQLAVKVARPEMPSEAFVMEAQNWIGLGLHPNINTCYYVRKLGGSTCIFSEYAAGGSLSSQLGKLQEKQRLLRLALECAWGLAFAHSQGMVHQDVKPDNVLLGEDGCAQITDFGLARVGTDGQVTNTGLTPAYASPEQSEGKPLTAATDVWSFAVMLLEMWLGERTWRSGSAVPHVLEASSVPAPVQQLLRDCLALQPEVRPTMSVVAQRLQEMLEAPVTAPQPAALRADSLNNRALSHLDLEDPARARQCLEQALALEPKHLLATYNLGLLQWRAAELSDEQLIARVQADPALVAAILAESSAGKAEATFNQHTHPITGLLLEGWTVTSCDTTGMVRSIDLTRGESRELLDFQNPVTCLKRSPDGGFTLAFGPVIGLYTKKPVYFQGAKQHIWELDWSRDGRWLASGGREGELLLWEGASQRCLRQFVGPGSDISGLDITGKHLVAASRDGGLRVYSLESGECLRHIKHRREIECMCLSPDRSRIACGVEREILIYDFATGTLLQKLRGLAHFPRAIAFAGEGEMMVSGDSAGYLRVWDLPGGRCRRSQKAHEGAIGSLVCQGSLAITGGQDGLVRSWSLAAGEPAAFQLTRGRAVGELSALEGQFRQHLERARQTDPATCLAELRKARSLNGFQTHPEVLQAWWELGQRLGRGALETVFQCSQEDAGLGLLCSLGVSQNGQVVALGGQRGMAFWQDEKRFDLDFDRTVSSCCLSAGGELLAFGVEGRVAGLWDVAAAKSTGGVEVGEHRDLALSLDGNWLLAGSRLWDLQKKQVSREFSGHEGEIWSGALSPDLRLAATGSKERTARLWNLSDGSCRAVLGGHQERVMGLHFNHDGSQLLSAGAGDLMSWDTRSGARLLEFESIRPHFHFCVRFSPDGSLVLSAGNDGVLRVFCAQSGRCLQKLSGHRGPVRALAWLPSGRFALSGGEDGTLRRWEFVWEIQAGAEPVSRLCHRVQEGRLMGSRPAGQAGAGRVLGGVPPEFAPIERDLWNDRARLQTLCGPIGSLALGLRLEPQDSWESQGANLTNTIRLSGELADLNDSEGWSQLAQRLFEQRPSVVVIALTEQFEDQWLDTLAQASSSGN